MYTDLTVLMKQHAVQGYNFALGLTRNEQNAKDLVQQTLVKVLKHFKEFDHARPFAPWFNRILKNGFLDGVRRLEHKLMSSLDAPVPGTTMEWAELLPGHDITPLEHLEKMEMHKLVRRALDLLPVPYKRAITLCDIDRYSYLRIAQILKCPLGTVRSRTIRDAFKCARFLSGFHGPRPPYPLDHLVQSRTGR